MLPVDEPPLDAALIGIRYQALVARLRASAESADRDPDGFRVVAVTKGFDLSLIRVALDAGLSRFGENRVQEAIAKIQVASGAEWHLVGRLQGNKARPAIRAFAMIHSVDSLGLLQRLDRVAAEESRTPALLLQVNISGAPNQAGFPGDWFAAELRGRGPLLAALDGLHAARVEGLMTIAPFGAPPAEARAVFATLRGMRDTLQEASGRAFPELSMGMTADVDAAVAEGSTLVRVGTAIFGPRPV